MAAPPLSLAPRRWPLLLGAALALTGVALVAAAQGSVAIPPATLVQMLLQRAGVGGVETAWPAAYETILFQIRLPRILLAGLVGAALGGAGAAYQGLFRNPLADPYLIGVAAGAGLGATVALLLPPLRGVSTMTGLVPLAAFAGAMATALLAYGIARTGRTLPVATLLLAGIAISSLASSLTSLLMALSGEELRVIFSWLMGSFALSSWERLLGTLPYMAASGTVILLLARALNVLQVGEEEARQLGLDVEWTKLLLVASASLATAAAVSVSGLIGFVGLVMPHVVRLLGGHDYRTMLPGAMLAGAAFLILADTIARTILAPMELPVGVVTAFSGAPFFLYLLRRRRQLLF
ncbi:MAG: iron chelate uptake ABC transporter family permease subunit [Chloroflexi bacterium]|nr:iron chelate uptake ABC transporter family permease subunit [Chloroflexota bacterium]